MKKNDFLVSIVVPVYNMADSLEKSVKNIINQDYKNIEIILVDDGSKDNSWEVCNKLAKEDERVKVFHTENRGSGPARNKGIEKSSGDYIYFPDADDLMALNAISVLVDATENKKHDLIVFGYENIDPSNKVVFSKTYELSCQFAEKIRHSYSEYINYSAKWGIQGAPWNKFFSAKIIKENNVEYPPLRRHQDEGFIGRYMCYSNNVKFIPNILYTHYTNDLKMEWNKYPKDYIDAVIGLYKVRQETILTWNKEDIKTKQIINNSYICNIIKSLELSFSPKFSFTTKERYDWIKENIKKANIREIETNKFLGRYQKYIYKCVLKEKYKTIYIIFKLKVVLEKNNVLNLIRKK